MRKKLLPILFLLILLIVGGVFAKLQFDKAEESTPAGLKVPDKPAKAYLKMGNKKFPLILGTHTEKGAIYDSKSPYFMAKGKEISVKAGQVLQLYLEAQTARHTSLAYQQSDAGAMMAIKIRNSGQFTAPIKKGNYYYSYNNVWDKANTVYAEADYAFALQVR